MGSLIKKSFGKLNLVNTLRKLMWELNKNFNDYGNFQHFFLQIASSIILIISFAIVFANFSGFFPKIPLAIPLKIPSLMPLM